MDCLRCRKSKKFKSEKGLGWIDGLVFMVTEEAKELLKITTAAEVKKCKYCNRN